MSIKKNLAKKLLRMLYGKDVKFKVVPMPRKFIWLGESGNSETHVTMAKNQIYKTSAVSTSILLRWLKAGKIKFLEDDPREELPEDTILDVQKGTISTEKLFKHLDSGLSKVMEKR